MANFDIAYSLLKKHEGGYVNNPADRGGETYGGIARNIHPTWQGWSWIDNWKRSNGTPKVNQKFAALDPLVKEFFRVNYWNKYSIGAIQSQDVANIVLDAVVLHGRGSALVQDAINSVGANVAVDNAIGPVTIAAINRLPSASVVDSIIRVRLDYVRSLASGSQKQFLDGWQKRILSFSGGGGAFSIALLGFGVYLVFKIFRKK